MTSSGSVSIDVTWPTTHRVSQRSLRDVALDVRRLANSPPVQRGASFSAVSDPSERELIGIDDPGRVGDDGEGGHLVGRLDDRQAFVPNY